VTPERFAVTVNPKFYRATENMRLIGDATRAKDKLGWVAPTSLEALCAMMVAADLRRNQIGEIAQNF
jgi:GDPmannose 4,6-dehydratase